MCHVILNNSKLKKTTIYFLHKLLTYCIKIIFGTMSVKHKSYFFSGVVKLLKTD